MSFCGLNRSMLFSAALSNIEKLIITLQHFNASNNGKLTHIASSAMSAHSSVSDDQKCAAQLQMSKCEQRKKEGRRDCSCQSSQHLLLHLKEKTVLPSDILLYLH